MPTIRFGCPRCHSILEAEDSKAGFKVTCPRCQQKLQIPLPPPSQTILAPLVPSPPSLPFPAVPPPPQAILVNSPPPPQAILVDSPAEPLPMAEVLPVQPIPSKEPSSFDQGQRMKGNRKPTSKPIWPWVILGLLLSSGLILLIVLAVSHANPGAPVADTSMTGTLLVLSLIFFGGSGIVFSGIYTWCPSCHRWWARRFLRETVQEGKKCYGLVTRHADTSVWGSGSSSGTSYSPGSMPVFTNQSGSSSAHGSTSWKERVPVIRTTHLLHYKCNHCDHKWHVVKVKEVEDFER